jgi:hypothetical protein
LGKEVLEFANVLVNDMAAVLQRPPFFFLEVWNQ